MSKIRLGGVKVVENRAYLSSSCRREVDVLGNICSSLAAGRINLGLLTHVNDNGRGESLTAASTRNALRFSGFVLEMVDRGKFGKTIMENSVSRISVFPHDQSPEVTASVIATFRDCAIIPWGFSCSPSAITVTVSTTDLENAMNSIFDHFAFSSCASFKEWDSVLRMDEQKLNEVRFSYNEPIISIYGFTNQTGLDLWNISLPVEQFGDFGGFLSELGELNIKLPFLISNFLSLDQDLNFSFAMSREWLETAKKAIHKHLPGLSCYCQRAVSLILLHGPHFGDRYGIAQALVTALRGSSIPLLALSCAVSSISAVVAGDDPDKAIEALSTRFHIPKGMEGARGRHSR